MEPTQQPAPDPAASKPAPVMDVTPPPQTLSISPVDPNAPAVPTAEVTTTPKKVPKAPKTPKPPKQPSDKPIGLIVGTVLVMIVLAAVAIYGYMQAKK
jgi:hypothetical protein